MSIEINQAQKNKYCINLLVMEYKMVKLIEAESRGVVVRRGWGGKWENIRQQMLSFNQVK
jgi:hypothetical protein